MVFVAPFIGAAALLSGFAAGVPMRRDSAIGEAAVSAPDGTPITQTSTAQQTASAATVAASSVVTSASSGGYGSSSSGSSGSSGSWGSSGGCSSGDCGSGSGNSWDTTSISIATSTQAAWGSYQSPSYGSGSSSWGSSGSSGYNDCVQQCVASFGSPMQSYQPPPPTSTTDQSGSSGNGVTHTVIVAPSQGVLRYVPFAVNASVGDTIKFMWGANNHTVTKSNTLELCNKSSDPLFTSGTQNKDFTFTQVVNDTQPTFFHCGTPGHCQQGMFGIINPPSAFASPSSVDVMMQSMMANNSNLAAASAASDAMTANNAAAASWGGSMDMSGLPTWAAPYAAENVLYTRNFLAANPDTLTAQGTVDLGAAGDQPLMIPQDIGAVINNGADAASSSSPSSTAANTPASTSSSSATESSAVSQNSTNGASALASSKVLVGLAAAIASLFLL